SWGGSMKPSESDRQVANEPTLRLVSAKEMAGELPEIVDAVANHAFKIFERNGRPLGRGLEDWLPAEAALMHPVRLDISESDGTCTVRAEIPAFREREIAVSVDSRRVTIIAKRELRADDAGRIGEACVNQVFRTVELPSEVDITNDAIEMR